MKKMVWMITVVIALILASLPANAITNGVADTDNAYVGRMQGFDPGGTRRQCSGSVIAPGVFLTAGHCGVLTDVTLHFGADLDVSEQVVDATDVRQHPRYAPNNFGFQYDVAVVLFDPDIELPIGQLADENYVDSFPKKVLASTTFEAIGYGLVRNGANGNSAPLVASGERLIATQSYLNRHNQYLGLSIHTNKGSGGGCFGDSGGPHLMNGVIVSVTSNGDGNCVATDNTQRVDQPEIRNWLLSFSS